MIQVDVGFYRSVNPRKGFQHVGVWTGWGRLISLHDEPIMLPGPSDRIPAGEVKVMYR